MSDIFIDKFSHIKKGVRIIGLPNTEKNQKIKINDSKYLISEKEKERIKIKIVEILKYSTVVDFLEEAQINNTVPFCKSIQEGVNYYNMQSSAEEREKLRIKYNYGFLGIKFEIIDKDFIQYKKNKQKYQQLKTANH
jgi:ASC-1-like (ASCH) protein